MYTTKANYSKESSDMQTKLVRGFAGFHTMLTGHERLCMMAASEWLLRTADRDKFQIPISKL